MAEGQLCGRAMYGAGGDEHGGGDEHDQCDNDKVRNDESARIEQTAKAAALAAADAKEASELQAANYKKFEEAMKKVGNKKKAVATADLQASEADELSKKVIAIFGYEQVLFGFTTYTDTGALKCKDKAELLSRKVDGEKTVGEALDRLSEIRAEFPPFMKGPKYASWLKIRLAETSAWSSFEAYVKGCQVNIEELPNNVRKKLKTGPE